MALKRVSKRVKKAVRIMTDAEPQFVSLVSNGANQTPFNVVKSDEVVVTGTRVTSDDHESSEDSMGDKAKQATKYVVVKSAKEDAVDLQRLAFSAEMFDSEKAVRAYLSENGYEGGEVTAVEGGGFEVLARDEDDFAKVSPIEGKDGVTRYVGELTEEEEEGKETAEKSEAVDGKEGGKTPDPKSDEEQTQKTDKVDTKSPDEKTPDGNDTDPGEGAETVVKAADTFLHAQNPEVAKRYDDWMAMYSSGKDMKSVMANGADGLPPAFQEMGGAMVTAMRNALLDGETDSVGKIATEFGALVVKLAEVLDFATVPRELVEKAVDGEQKDKSQKSDDDQEHNEKVVDLVAKRVLELLGEQVDLQQVSKSVSEHSDKLGSTEEVVKTLGDTVKELQESVQKQAQTLEDLKRVGGPSRSSNGEDVDLSGFGLGGNGGSPVRRSEDDSLEDDFLKNQLGMR